MPDKLDQEIHAIVKPELLDWALSKVTMGRKELFDILEITDAIWDQWMKDGGNPTIAQARQLVSFGGLSLAFLYLPDVQTAEQCYQESNPPLVMEVMNAVVKMGTNEILTIGANSTITAQNQMVRTIIQSRNTIDQLVADIQKIKLVMGIPESNQPPLVLPNKDNIIRLNK